MLQELPLEVLRMIFKQITELKDLKSLCEVSKSLYQFAIPALYETLEISLSPGPKCSLLRRGRKNWGLVKGIVLEDSLHDYLDYQCPRKECRLEFSAPYLSDPYYKISVLGNTLMDILSCLTDNSLRRLSWDLGTCIPAEVLGESGYLAKRQQKIEHLSLVTDRFCTNACSGQWLLEFSQFNCLRTLSWRGLGSVEAFEVLRNCLELNALRLKDLTIELTDWANSYADWLPRGNDTYSSNLFMREILGLSRGELNRMLPCLRYLSLYKVSFDSAIPEIVCALNFSELRALKLSNCPSMYQLLDAITKSDLAVRLTSFEVVADAVTTQKDPTVHLEGFLKGFEGLEELYLMLKTAHWETMAEGILHHKTTLKRLVIHDRYFSEYEFKGCDSQIHWPKEFDTVLQETSLECLGISDTAPRLEEALVRFSRQPNYKILHIRSSADLGDELDCVRDTSEYISSDEDEKGSTKDTTEATGVDPPPRTSQRLSIEEKLITRVPAYVIQLALWAFGPHGLQHLQIIAFGDFSHHGRSVQRARLFGRNSEATSAELPFQYLTQKDRKFRQLVQENLEFLGACAVDFLMWG